MKSILQRIGALLGRTVEAVFGLLGGFICASAACLVAIHLYAETRYHPLILLALCFLLFIGFSVGGLLRPRYFCWFSGPLFSMCVGDGMHSNGENDFRWKDCIAMIGLFIALPFLLVGVFFQLHIIVALGAILFIAYAAWIPAMNAQYLSGPRGQ
jgi:hypothetical protein